MNNIFFEQRDGRGLITLNRPEALNALTTAMAEAMLAQLAAWREDDSTEAVVVQSAGGKAFCAGGDIRAIVKGTREEAIRFFTAEYRLNHLIHHYPKPYIALLDGIVMGGGVGISIHGSRRIVTENTLWAMPETAIGFYPDIGATYFLSRLPNEIGTYLALTGARLLAADLLALGLATEFVESKRLNDTPSYHLSLMGEVDRTTRSGERAGEGILRGVDPHPPVPAGTGPSLSHEGGGISRCFAFDTVEEIVAALKEEQSAFAEQTLATLSRLSPTSLKVTLRQVRRGKTLSFDEAMQSEFALTSAFLEAHDFREGVRAMIVDKDKAPRWQPARLEEVTDEMVDSYFAYPGETLTFL